MIPAQPQDVPFVAGALAELRLNGKRVGTVEVRGTSDSWSWGYFQPEPAFEEFAPLFGIWSLLMHADEESRRLSRAASEELRVAECEIDAIRASLLLETSEDLRHLRQINIDGSLIEWKEV